MLDIETSLKGSTKKKNSSDKTEDKAAKKEAEAERVRGYSVQSGDRPLEDVADPSATGQGMGTWISSNGKYSIGPKSQLSVQLEDERVEIKDQIQMYAPNHLLTHPLVSPVLQPTLGGLPPLLIQTGGGELLRDEQIYLAHKAAQPLAYIPPPSNNQTAESIQAQAASYRPTNVQLQVWDDLCHVAPTLSFTRPAKHMYRSIAQFGAWALARAQKKSIDILDDDDISFMSSDSGTSSESDKAGSGSSSDDPKSADKHPKPTKAEKKAAQDARVGRAGDAIPPFERHMIRQRIDRHGRIYALAPKEELVALNIPSVDVGVPKTGPVSKWMKAQSQWNNKFSKQKIKIQKQRIKDMQKGFEGFEGETPPPTALAGRRIKGMKAEKAKKRSWGMSMWAGWGSKHDSATVSTLTLNVSHDNVTNTPQIVREEKADQNPDTEASTSTQDPANTAIDGTTESAPTRSRANNLTTPGIKRSRSHSRHSAVTYKGQTGLPLDDLSKIKIDLPTPGLADATTLAPERSASPLPSPTSTSELSQPGIGMGMGPNIIVSDNPENSSTIIPETDTLTTRPTAGGIAYPFSLKVDGPDGRDVNASTLTLASLNITTPPAVDDVEEKQRGSMFPAGESSMVPGGESESVNEQVLKEERPGVERFFTAGAGAGLFSDGVVDEKVERPGVERFETANDGLGLGGAANSEKP